MVLRQLPEDFRDFLCFLINKNAAKGPKRGHVKLHPIILGPPALSVAVPCLPLPEA